MYAITKFTKIEICFNDKHRSLKFNPNNLHSFIAISDWHSSLILNKGHHHLFVNKLLEQNIPMLFISHRKPVNCFNGNQATVEYEQNSLATFKLLATAVAMSAASDCTYKALYTFQPPPPCKLSTENIVMCKTIRLELWIKSDGVKKKKKKNQLLLRLIKLILLTQVENCRNSSNHIKREVVGIWDILPPIDWNTTIHRIYNSMLVSTSRR